VKEVRSGADPSERVGGNDEGESISKTEGGMRRQLISLCALAFVVMALAAGSMAADMEINIIVQPKTLVIESESEWLTVHTDIALSAVDTSSLMINGLAVSWWKADAKGNLVAKFDINDVKAMVEPGEAFFEMTGVTTAGVSFSGTDTVPVR
jgi:hypothetical protein